MDNLHKSLIFSLTFTYSGLVEVPITRATLLQVFTTTVTASLTVNSTLTDNSYFAILGNLG